MDGVHLSGSVWGNCDYLCDCIQLRVWLRLLCRDFPMFFHHGHWLPREKGPVCKGLIKPLLMAYLPLTLWPKQVTWPSQISCWETLYRNLNTGKHGLLEDTTVTVYHRQCLFKLFYSQWLHWTEYANVNGLFWGCLVLATFNNNFLLVRTMSINRLCLPMSVQVTLNKWDPNNEVFHFYWKTSYKCYIAVW